MHQRFLLNNGNIKVYRYPMVSTILEQSVDRITRQKRNSCNTTHESSEFAIDGPRKRIFRNM